MIYIACISNSRGDVVRIGSYRLKEKQAMDDCDNFLKKTIISMKPGDNVFIEAIFNSEIEADLKNLRRKE